MDFTRDICRLLGLRNGKTRPSFQKLSKLDHNFSWSLERMTRRVFESNLTRAFSDDPSAVSSILGKTFQSPPPLSSTVAYTTSKFAHSTARSCSNVNEMLGFQKAGVTELKNRCRARLGGRRDVAGRPTLHSLVCAGMRRLQIGGKASW